MSELHRLDLPGSARTFRKQKHHFLHHTWEYTFVEEHQAQPREALREEASDGSGVVDREKLGRKNQGHPTRRLEEAGGVDQEGSP